MKATNIEAAGVHAATPDPKTNCPVSEWCAPPDTSAPSIPRFLRRLPPLVPRFQGPIVHTTVQQMCKLPLRIGAIHTPVASRRILPLSSDETQNRVSVEFEFACSAGMDRLSLDTEWFDQLALRLYARGFREGVESALSIPRRLRSNECLESRQG